MSLMSVTVQTALEEIPLQVFEMDTELELRRILGDCGNKLVTII